MTHLIRDKYTWQSKRQPCQLERSQNYLQPATQIILFSKVSLQVEETLVHKILFLSFRTLPLYSCRSNGRRQCPVTVLHYVGYTLQNSNITVLPMTENIEMHFWQHSWKHGNLVSYCGGVFGQHRNDVIFDETQII